MISKIFLLKISIFFAALCVASVWFFSEDSDKVSTAIMKYEKPKPVDRTADTATLAMPVASVPIASVPEGITFDAARQRISVRINNTARLLIVQRVAEIAGFDFSLPDQSIDYWSAPVSLTIHDQPLTAALSTIIGAETFTLEMSYDATFSLHKVSAVFLTANPKNLATATPLNKKIPLQNEREFSEAPDVNFSANYEQQMRRSNFFNADEQTRVAILQEMSPVGADLDYIITSLQRDKNAFVRAAAAQRLSVSGSYLATQSLLEALSDADPDVVKAAANSLITLGDASVIPAMEAKLGGSEQGKAILQEANQRIQSRFSLASDGNH